MRVRILRGLAAVAAGAVALGLPAAPASAAPAAPTPVYRVFATREGLVGGTTANGHVIVENDHFVALPSWRALAGLDNGDRSVRVCTVPGTGTPRRCVYEPVWDVGPWNTHDDWWSRRRENWRDLPAGTPQAAAAFTRRHNGGLDQYGRGVLNPAGIDLADGTMWSGLGVAGDGLWVDVSVLWTEPGPFGTVVTATGDPLRLRGGPGTGYRVVGEAAAHTRVPVRCQARGAWVTGTVRRTDLWDRLAPGQYVSHAYVADDPGAWYPPC